MSSFTGETKTASTGETKTSPTTPSLEWVRMADQSNAFSLTNSCLPWNYPHPNDNQHIVTVTSITSSMILLQPELIPKEYKKHTELHEDHLHSQPFQQSYEQSPSSSSHHSALR